MKSRFFLQWDPLELSKSLKIRLEDVNEYFTDGRRISFLIERRLYLEHEGWMLAPSEGAHYDLLDPQRKKWEVRSLTKGVYFNPSKDVGSGRSFKEASFLTKLKLLEGFIIADILEFPKVQIYKISSNKILSLYQSGLLGKRAQVSRKKFMSII